MVRDRLIGHWHLVSFVEHQAPDAPRHVLGAGANGSITYTASGHMAALIGGSERPLFRGAWSDISDSAKAQNYDRLGRLWRAVHRPRGSGRASRRHLLDPELGRHGP